MKAAYIEATGPAEATIKYGDVTVNSGGIAVPEQFQQAQRRIMDIVTEPGRGGFMKKVRIKTGQSWLPLANLVDAVVICSELGEAIAPAEGDARREATAT